MRVEVHVRPNSSTTSVGGEYGGALVIRVVEPPDSGRATDAAMRALARAMGVPPRTVTLVRGATSRRKLLDVAVEPTDAERVRSVVIQLLAQSQK